MATTSTRNAGKVTKGQSGISESERDSKIQEAQARAQKAKPGSLTSKANLVSRYNQGLETAEPKVESKDKELSVLIRSVKVSEYEKGRNRDEW